jgi:hypothetical protein
MNRQKCSSGFLHFLVVSLPIFVFTVGSIWAASFGRAPSTYMWKKRARAVTPKIAAQPFPLSHPTTDDSLVALWHGDGDATDALGRLHGAAINVDYTPGVMGRAFLLNGRNAYVRISDSHWLEIDKELTLEMWFKRNDEQSYGTLIDKRTWDSCNYGVIMSSDWGFQLYYDDPRVYDGNQYEISFSPVPRAGVFHHLVGILRQVDDEVVQLETYIDGELVQRDARRGNLRRTYNDGALGIGAARDGAGEYFEGAIDEIAIYRRALSFQEISSHYHSVAGQRGR